MSLHFCVIYFNTATRREAGRVSHFSTFLTCSFNHLRFFLIPTDNLPVLFIYCCIYIHLLTVNCKNDSNNKTRKQKCWRNFSNRRLWPLELSSQLIMMVSSIESRKHELIYTIRRENQMGRKLMHTLIKETKRAGNDTKALL